MPGLVDPLTFNQFADAANQGKLTPQLHGGGAGGGGSGTATAAPGGSGGGNIPPMLAKVIGQIMLSDVKSRFSTGTDPTGSKWRPLKHARPNGGDVPLRDTGVLMASFTAGSDGRSVWVGTTHPGAALHNFGGTVRGKGKMLAIPLTKEAKRSGGPRRWKHGKLVFRPTRKPRVFLLMGGDVKPPAKKPKAAKRGAKRAKKGRVGILIAGLRKRIADVRKKAGKRKSGKAKRRGGAARGPEGQLRKLLAKLRGVEAKAPKSVKGSKGKDAGPPLVAQFLLVDQVTIPARQFMGVSEKAWGQIEDATQEFMLRGWLDGPVSFGTSIG